MNVAQVLSIKNIYWLILDKPMPYSGGFSMAYIQRHLSRINLVRALALLLLFLLFVCRPLFSSQAQGGLVNIWLTTPNGINQMTPQPDLTFSPSTITTNPVIDVNDSKMYQQMVGFGGAMTDSSAWLLYNKMSVDQRDILMHNLFDPNTGIGISFVRLQMGASDFSVNGPYTYDEMPAGQADPNMDHFSIEHDKTYIIPVLQQALRLNPNLKFVASPWTPPGWMKTMQSMMGTVDGHASNLLPQYYQAYAAYIVKFIQAYKAQGIPIYAITPLNEPLYPPDDYPGMKFEAPDETAFIKNNLGPALARAGLSTKILAYDHGWDQPSYPQTVLSDPTARSYTAGIGWHCYIGDPAVMDTFHTQYPGKDAFETECSTGIGKQGYASPVSTSDALMNSTQHWARGVELWNLALDPDGEPHSGGCSRCTGVVSVNQATGQVTYSNEYYVLGQFSKFVRPGAVHTGSNNLPNIQSVSFKNPDSSRVLIAHNTGTASSTFTVRWNATTAFNYTLPADSTATFRWFSTAQDFDPGYAINSGGETIGGFSADNNYQGGETAKFSAPIDSNNVERPASESVYQSERFGNFTYTFPNLKPNVTYKVRLHFSENYWNGSGKRIFNVSINGRQFLRNFDIFATTGAQNKAIVEETTAKADAQGNIVLQYSSRVDKAKSSGIEILPQ